MNRKKDLIRQAQVLEAFSAANGWQYETIQDRSKKNKKLIDGMTTGITLHKWLVALVKPINQWYYEVSKCAPLCFQPKSVTISRTADRWFISFNVEYEQVLRPKPHPVVGVDLGIKALAVLSTGIVVEGAKSYRKYSKKLSRLQWMNRHKQIGSTNCKRASNTIARLHRKIANIRKDTLHKLTSYLAQNHSRIGIENLNVSGMMANHKLAKAIQDMGFGEFKRQLEYKCQLYGSTLIVVNRWYPSTKTCSRCHTEKDEMPLSERVFRCDNCGFECDRDLNASFNLEQAAS